MSGLNAWLESLPVWTPYLMILIIGFFGHRLEKANEHLVDRLNRLEDKLEDLTSKDDDFYYLGDD